MTKKEVDDLLAKLREVAKEREKPCPSCGHCPTCGHRNAPAWPRYPWYVYPYYQPVYTTTTSPDITWGGGVTTTGISVSAAENTVTAQYAAGGACSVGV